MNGVPLLVDHGAPLQIILPCWDLIASVEWLTNITALTEPCDGYQQVKTYLFKAHKDDRGIHMQPKRAKSLMIG